MPEITLPVPGEDREVWGPKLNNVLIALNTAFDTVPTLMNGKIDASVVPDLSSTYATQDNLALKASLAGATFTGTVTAPVSDKGGQLYNALAYGVVGDGVTDNSAALNSLINTVSTNGGGVVFLPYRASGYAAGAIVLKSNVTLRGDRRVTLKRTGAASVVFINATGVTNVAVENFSIDPAGLTTSATFRVSTGTTGYRLSNCDITDSAQPVGVYALDTQSGTSRILIEDCDFHDMGNNIRLQLGASNVRIQRNRFTVWRERCIYVLGTASYSCADVTLFDNRFTDMGTGGTVRQPVAVQGVDAKPHERINLLFNKAIGTSTSVNDPVTPGTADLFSLQHTVDFLIVGNHSIGSGDVGITIAEQSTRGVVALNVVRDANSCGIAIGAGTTTDVGHMSVVGNTLMNNGQDTQGDRTANRSGVWMRNAHSVVCGLNVMGDDQTTKTQQSGYIIRDSDNIQLGIDLNAGLAVGMYDTSGGNVTNSFRAADPVALT